MPILSPSSWFSFFCLFGLEHLLLFLYVDFRLALLPLLLGRLVAAIMLYRFFLPYHHLPTWFLDQNLQPKWLFSATLRSATPASLSYSNPVTLLSATLLRATLLSATLPSATLLWATLLSATLPSATLLWATLLSATLPSATLLWATLLSDIYSIVSY